MVFNKIKCCSLPVVFTKIENLKQNWNNMNYDKILMMQ